MNNDRKIFCPACNKECKKIMRSDVELDECPTCKGIWFDPGELSQGFEKTLPDISRRKSTSISCPICAEGLVSYEIDSERRPIKIYNCLCCKGIWIDKKNIDLMENKSKIASSSRVYSDKDNIRMLFPGIEIKEKDYHPALYLFSLLFSVPVEIYKPVRRFPYGLFLLVIANLLIFLSFPPSFFKIFGLIPSQAFNSGKYYRFITYSFFHVGWLHIILNMYLLWIFGDNIYSFFYERYKGNKGIVRFFAFSVFATVFAGFTHVLLMRFFADQNMLNIPLVGASGLVSAYIAAYYRKFPDARIYQVFLFYPFKVNIKVYFLFYMGLNLIMAYRYGIYSSVSWQCHLGGLLAGYFFVDMFLKKE